MVSLLCARERWFVGREVLEKIKGPTSLNQLGNRLGGVKRLVHVFYICVWFFVQLSSRFPSETVFFFGLSSLPAVAPRTRMRCAPDQSACHVHDRGACWSSRVVGAKLPTLGELSS